MYRQHKNSSRKIKAEIPEIVIENCSSGGHRLRAVHDGTGIPGKAFPMRMKRWRFPLIAANMHKVIRPEQRSQIWAVLHTGDSDNRIFIHAVLLGRMCLSGDIYDLSEAQWKPRRARGMDFYGMASGNYPAVASR